MRLRTNFSQIVEGAGAHGLFTQHSFLTRSNVHVLFTFTRVISSAFVKTSSQSLTTLKSDLTFLLNGKLSLPSQKLKRPKPSNTSLSAHAKKININVIGMPGMTRNLLNKSYYIKSRVKDALGLINWSLNLRFSKYDINLKSLVSGSTTVFDVIKKFEVKDETGMDHKEFTEFKSEYGESEDKRIFIERIGNEEERWREIEGEESLLEVLGDVGSVREFPELWVLHGDDDEGLARFL